MGVSEKEVKMAEGAGASKAESHEYWGFRDSFWDDKRSRFNIVMEFCRSGDLAGRIETAQREGHKFASVL